MPENKHQSNNGHSPFRRYTPAADNNISNGNVAPLTPPATTGKPTPKANGVSSRRTRNARSRWRHWVQSPPAKSERHDRPPVQGRSPQSNPKPGTTQDFRQANRSKTGNPAQFHSPTFQNEPSRFVQNPADALPDHRSRSTSTTNEAQSSPKQVRLNNPAPSQRVAPVDSRSPSAKVTPMHRQPRNQASSSNPADRSTLRRDRKPRRSRRKPPQPVLYGIRLLILGTGIAAIVGTVLSSLNNDQSVAVSNVAGDSPAENRDRNSQRVSPALAQPLPLANELASVKTDLVALEAMTPGLDQAVFFYDLETGNYIDLNGSESVAAASTIKVPILIAFLQAVDAGTVRLDQAITLRDDMIASGSGDMQFDEVGTQYTALEVASEMIVSSDNTATNLMISLLGGTEALNQQFRDWGLESTVLRNLLPDLDGTNTTSSRDLVRAIALVDQGELLSLRSRDRLFNIMQRTINRALIPDGLGDDSAIAYNKTGDIGTSLGDVALVDVFNGKRYLVSILVERPFNDGRASELIRRVSGRLYEEMSQPTNPIGGRTPSSAAPEGSPSSDEAPTTPDTVVPLETEPETYIAPDSQPLSDDLEVPPG